MLKTIALDAMGGDHGPKVVVPAALQILKKYDNVKLLLVGLEAQLIPLFHRKAAMFKSRWEIVPATEVVGMDESPAHAMRKKKNSSMRVAIDLVKQQRAHAVVSAGNTGALMATARYVLKTLPGIDRPAIIAAFPTTNEEEVRILDLGANVDSTPKNLFQFAVMGSILAEATHGIESPRVALLNVGEEMIKGNELVKATSELFEKHNIFNYVGYVEGDTIFKNVADVVVCDGFVGNITLKAVEGAAKLIAKYTREEFKANWRTKLTALFAMPVLRKIRMRVDPDRYNGASLIGLNGIVIKSHGSANRNAFIYAIEEAIIEVDKNIPSLIKQKLSSVLEEFSES